MQTIIAYNYGAQEHNRAKRALLMSIIAGSIILGIGFILIQTIPHNLVAIFTNNNELSSIAVNGMKIYTGMLPFIGISILGAVYFQSIGSAKVSVVLSLLRQVIILIPVIIIVPKIYGLNGVWVSQPISDLLAMTIVCVFLINEFKKEKYKKKVLS
ncbi:hypothetical protein SDC9_191763 [bioreactor metagenome]|uniref:Multidrug export protein MepA n=2 Tax=root TaxID=1 RepID=A0A645I0D2_9ZZZZ